MQPKQFLQSILVLDTLQHSIQNVVRQTGLFFNQTHETLTLVRKYPHALLKLHEAGRFQDVPNLISQRRIFLRNVEDRNAPFVIPSTRLEQLERIQSDLPERIFTVVCDRKFFSDRSHIFELYQPLYGDFAPMSVSGAFACEFVKLPR